MEDKVFSDQQCFKWSTIKSPILLWTQIFHTKYLNDQIIWDMQITLIFKTSNLTTAPVSNCIYIMEL